MVEAKAEIDVYPLFIRCTLDIICGTYRPKTVFFQPKKYLDSEAKNLIDQDFNRPIMVEKWIDFSGQNARERIIEYSIIKILKNKNKLQSICMRMV